MLAFDNGSSMIDDVPIGVHGVHGDYPIPLSFLWNRTLGPTGFSVSPSFGTNWVLELIWV